MLFLWFSCFVALLSSVSGMIYNPDGANFDGFGEGFSYPQYSSLVVKVYHAFDTSLKYEERGSISINNFVPAISQKPLTLHQLSLLKDAAINGDFYYIKAEAYKNEEASKTESPYQVSTTYLRACSLLESSLQDSIIVNIDATGRFVSLSANIPNKPCDHTEPAVALRKVHDIENKLSNNFNTTIMYTKTNVFQGPETKTYLARIEQEKIEKMKVAKQDNRSFLAKYWMYMVPVVIFMFISSAVNPEAGAAQS